MKPKSISLSHVTDETWNNQVGIKVTIAFDRKEFLDHVLELSSVSVTRTPKRDARGKFIAAKEGGK